MARLGKTEVFQKGVRDALLEHLPEGFVADPERHPRSVRMTEWGEQDLWVTLVKGGLLDLRFGVTFSSYSEVHRTFKGPPLPGWLNPRFSMTSSNMRQMKGLPYPQLFPLTAESDEGFWFCDMGDAPSSIAQRVLGCVQGVVLPFFRRFSSLQAVRESLVHADGWLMSERMEKVLLIDIALNDKAHFKEYIFSNWDNKDFSDTRDRIAPKLIEKFPAFAYDSLEGRTSGMEATAG